MITKSIEKKDKIITGNDFNSDSLSFEELQNLKSIKKDMLKGEYYTFNEIFDEV